MSQGARGRPSRLSHEYSEQFWEAREAFPKRDGANPWDEAWRQWKLRLREGYTEEEMLQGTRRYRLWCEFKDKVGTEYVMQARRFYGRDCYFLEDWTVQSDQAVGFPEREDPTVPRFTTPHERHK